MLNTRKGTDGGISVSGLNEDQNGFRSWQQDDGVVHIFGSPEVEDIADGKGMTGGIGSPDSVMREVAASSILTQGFGASFVKRKSKKALLQRKQSASNLSSPSAKEFREPTRVSLLDERTEPRDCAPPNMNVKNPAIEAVARPVEGSQSQEQQQQLYAPKPRRPSMGPACARAEAPHHAGRRLIAKVSIQAVETPDAVGVDDTNVVPTSVKNGEDELRSPSPVNARGSGTDPPAEIGRTREVDGVQGEDEGEGPPILPPQELPKTPQLRRRWWGGAQSSQGRDLRENKLPSISPAKDRDAVPNGGRWWLRPIRRGPNSRDLVSFTDTTTRVGL